MNATTVTVKDTQSYGEDPMLTEFERKQLTSLPQW